MIIRRAKPEEAQILTDIAMRSKAYWGYDQAFMEACRDALTVTEEKIEHHAVYLAEDGGVAGFYSLVIEDGSAVLDDLFIDPLYIGTGCGRILFEHASALATKKGVRAFTIDADPNAEGFYLKMGAERVGEAESTAIPGRRLPQMRMIVSE